MPASTTSQQRNQPADAQKLYDTRSAHYDKSWHPRFARHVIELIAPLPGESVLDLACGTGLATFQAAKAVRPTGRVVGVDISSGMLTQAREKQAEEDATNVHFFNHSITDLETLDAIKDEKFDVITCVSALVLLPKAAEALKQWTTFLKPSGRLLVDVTHPRSQVGHITLERVGNTLGRPVPSYRLPFQQPSDLSTMLTGAGLSNVAIRLLSQQDRVEDDQYGDEYQPQDLKDFICDIDKPVLRNEYVVGEADAMFDNVVKTTYGEIMAGDDVRPEAKKLFRKEWKKLVSDDPLCGAPGTIEEIDGVYVGIGFKAEGDVGPESVLGMRKADGAPAQDRQDAGERMVLDL